jgi:predicted DNA binding protein
VATRALQERSSVSLVASVHAAHPDLALSPTIRECQDTTIRVMPQAATDPTTGLFFFFIDGGGESIEAAFERDHTVERWTKLSRSESGSVYRLQHSPETILLSPKTVEYGGLMREAISDATGWTLRLQFPDRKALAHLWEFCKAKDVVFDLRQMFRHQPWMDPDLGALTDPQLDALITAYEEGYFEEPRAISLEGLADILDISPTAVGGRIRRGTAALIESTLIEG